MTRPLDDFPARRVLIAGLVCGVAALVLADLSKAGPYTPPTRAKAQRLAAAAYDPPLRSVFGRHAMITVRCRASTQPRRFFCTTHVVVDSADRYIQFTRLLVHRDYAANDVDIRLRGTVHISDAIHFESTTWDQVRP